MNNIEILRKHIYESQAVDKYLQENEIIDLMKKTKTLLNKPKATIGRIEKIRTLKEKENEMKLSTEKLNILKEYERLVPLYYKETDNKNYKKIKEKITEIDGKIEAKRLSNASDKPEEEKRLSISDLQSLLHTAIRDIEMYEEDRPVFKEMNDILDKIETLFKDEKKLFGIPEFDRNGKYINNYKKGKEKIEKKTRLYR